MKSTFYHLQTNIDYKNVTFYKELFTTLGWTVIFENPDEVIGFTSGSNGDIWFAQAEQLDVQNYDHRGFNHLSIRVTNIEDVETIVQFLSTHDTQPLFETPRHRPDFAVDDSETYYQVMFTSPDNILFEVVYIGSK